MTTAAQRLAALSGLSGASAAEHLRTIASGAAGTAAALLVAYSGLASATAAEHLLAERVAATRPGGGYDAGKKPAKRKYAVEIDGVLRIFDSIEDMQRAVAVAEQRQDPVRKWGAVKSPSSRPSVPKTERSPEAWADAQIAADGPGDAGVDLAAVQAFAQVVGRIEQFNRAYSSRQYEQILALFRWMQEDEQDTEALLMTVM